MLDNAVKYTPSGGAVSVKVKNYELFSAIRVTDTGPGISEEEQAKIFRAVSTARPAPGRRRGGHRPLPHPADRGKTGRLCEGGEHARAGKHIFLLIVPGES